MVIDKLSEARFIHLTRQYKTHEQLEMLRERRLAQQQIMQDALQEVGENSHQHQSNVAENLQDIRIVPLELLTDDTNSVNNPTFMIERYLAHMSLSDFSSIDAENVELMEGVEDSSIVWPLPPWEVLLKELKILYADNPDMLAFFANFEEECNKLCNFPDNEWSSDTSPQLDSLPRDSTPTSPQPGCSSWNQYSARTSTPEPSSTASLPSPALSPITPGVSVAPPAPPCSPPRTPPRNRRVGNARALLRGYRHRVAPYNLTQRQHRVSLKI